MEIVLTVLLIELLLLGILFSVLVGVKNRKGINKEELLSKLEAIESEYKGYKWGMSHDAKSKENSNYASGLCEATERIIKLIKED